MITTLRRIVNGGAGVRPLAEEWCWRKLDDRLTAPARVLLTYADPGVGHDGALYTAAGAHPVGQCKNGKLAFAWALDPSLTGQLAKIGAPDA